MDVIKKLRNNILFQHLSDDDIRKLLNVSKELNIKENDFFIHEGDVAKTFYFILQGNVAIIKSHLSETEHVIGHLKEDDIVGEIALLDHKPRSASAKATTNSKLLSIPFGKLEELSNESKNFKKVITQIIEYFCGHLRETNTKIVKALEDQLHEAKMRIGLGNFLINVVVALSLFAFFLSWLTNQEANAAASTIITLPLTLGFVVLFISIMKSSEFPLKTFGLTIQGWQKAIIESLAFTAILCLIILIIKWILVHNMQKYMGQPIFSPFVTIDLNKDSSFTKVQIWWIIFILYWLVISPLQELIVRGGLQGPLEVFLTGKRSIFKAILVSNLMFSTAHLAMGVTVAFIVFWAGLFFGWLYSRHHTLIGVIIAHALLGTWATMIVGF